jgi:hypothetical protein
MELDRVIGKRKMIRKYDQNRQVPEQLINKLLDNASKASMFMHLPILFLHWRISNRISMIAFWFYLISGCRI